MNSFMPIVKRVDGNIYHLSHNYLTSPTFKKKGVAVSHIVFKTEILIPSMLGAVHILKKKNY